MDAHVISLASQKGGTAKTTTCANLGIGLAQAGRKVLLVDADAQGSLTLSLGWEPDELPITLYDLMIKAIQDRPVTHGEGMLHHEEGVDLLPANIELAGMEMSLISVMYHETIYDFCSHEHESRRLGTVEDDVFRGCGVHGVCQSGKIGIPV